MDTAARDTYVSMEEEIHEYTITHPVWLERVSSGKGTIGVTTLIHKFFEPFNAPMVAGRIFNGIRKKYSSWIAAGHQRDPTEAEMHSIYTESELKYWGMTVDQIRAAWDQNGKEASALGTAMHKSIEDYLNSRGLAMPSLITPEFQYFLKFWSDLTIVRPDLTFHRSEWMVYDEDIGLAGSIDCIMTDRQGYLYLLDWKRSKDMKLRNKYQKGMSIFSQFEDCDWSRYQLQLNIYREILERKYGKRVVAMGNVVCHPNQITYCYYPVAHIDLKAVWTMLPAIAASLKH
jgi:ATP-dependent exoDNAse (exonuclease V) beta subunit